MWVQYPLWTEDLPSGRPSEGLSLTTRCKNPDKTGLLGDSTKTYDPLTEGWGGFVRHIEEA
jgi:hypothetical protein